MFKFPTWRRWCGFTISALRSVFHDTTAILYEQFEIPLDHLSNSCAPKRTRRCDYNIPYRPLFSFQVAQRALLGRIQLLRFTKRHNAMQRHVTDHADGTTPIPIVPETPPRHLSQRQLSVNAVEGNVGGQRGVTECFTRPASLRQRSAKTTTNCDIRRHSVRSQPSF